MWRLNLPVRQVGPTLITCIQGMRDKRLMLRLKSIEPHLVQAETAYRRFAAAAMLNTILPSTIIANGVSSGDMVFVYDKRLVKSKAGRTIYDELRSAAENDRCPLCGHRQVTTLDHHLPKSHYTELTITPVNLIPACSDCNRAKRDIIPITPQEVTLHPYFDNVENDRWLYATVIRSSPASLSFFVQEPNNWCNIMVARVKNHFDTLKLDALYRSQAAEELINIRHRLIELFKAGGASVVQRHLQETALSCATARVNSWRTACYEALAQSSWFCDGGFNP